MGYKNSDPCLQKAFDDERLFILMARDPTAPAVIRYWMRLNQQTQSAEKLAEAEACAQEMQKRCAEFNQRKEHVAQIKLFTEEYCDMCDGCGWYEGGTALKTKCHRCNGTGIIHKPNLQTQ